MSASRSSISRRRTFRQVLTPTSLQLLPLPVKQFLRLRSWTSKKQAKAKEALCYLLGLLLVSEETPRLAPLRRVSSASGHWLRVWQKNLARKIFMWDRVLRVWSFYLMNLLLVSGRACKWIDCPWCHIFVDLTLSETHNQSIIDGGVLAARQVLP